MFRGFIPEETYVVPSTNLSFLVLVQIHRVNMRLVIGSDAWTRLDWARWNSVQSLVSEGYPAPPLLVADSPESERPFERCDCTCKRVKSTGTLTYSWLPLL